VERVRGNQKTHLVWQRAPSEARQEALRSVDGIGRRLSDVQKFAQFRDARGRSAFEVRNGFDWAALPLHVVKAALFSVAAQTVSRANPFTTLHLSLLLTNVQICSMFACVISDKLATTKRP
jgi:hypothetical protein